MFKIKYPNLIKTSHWVALGGKPSIMCGELGEHMQCQCEVLPDISLCESLEEEFGLKSL